MSFRWDRHWSAFTGTVLALVAIGIADPRPDFGAMILATLACWYLDTHIFPGWEVPR
jgi:hypothetical protein